MGKWSEIYKDECEDIKEVGRWIAVQKETRWIHFYFKMDFNALRPIHTKHDIYMVVIKTFVLKCSECKTTAVTIKMYRNYITGITFKMITCIS